MHHRKQHRTARDPQPRTVCKRNSSMHSRFCRSERALAAKECELHDDHLRGTTPRRSGRRKEENRVRTLRQTASEKPASTLAIHRHATLIDTEAFRCLTSSACCDRKGSDTPEPTLNPVR